MADEYNDVIEALSTISPKDSKKGLDLSKIPTIELANGQRVFVAHEVRENEMGRMMGLIYTIGEDSKQDYEELLRSNGKLRELAKKGKAERIIDVDAGLSQIPGFVMIVCENKNGAIDTLIDEEKGKNLRGHISEVTGTVLRSVAPEIQKANPKMKTLGVINLFTDSVRDPDRSTEIILEGYEYEITERRDMDPKEKGSAVKVVAELPIDQFVDSS